MHVDPKCADACNSLILIIFVALHLTRWIWGVASVNNGNSNLGSFRMAGCSCSRARSTFDVGLKAQAGYEPNLRVATDGRCATIARQVPSRII